MPSPFPHLGIGRKADGLKPTSWKSDLDRPRQVVIPAGMVILAVLGLIVYALVTPVATHIA